jgi:hypothetical protein
MHQQPTPETHAYEEEEIKFNLKKCEWQNMAIPVLGVTISNAHSYSSLG